MRPYLPQLIILCITAVPYLWMLLVTATDESGASEYRGFAIAVLTIGFAFFHLLVFLLLWVCGYYAEKK